MNNKVCFIISHKYFRGYPSFLSYYLDNIQRLYPEALTIVVDNNSVYAEDIFRPLRERDNVVFLANDIECKFEIGAYQVGFKYITDNNLTEEYSYYMCTQDNFVLKNKFDFDAMESLAFPIATMPPDHHHRGLANAILNHLGLEHHWDKIGFCWCSSFAVHNSKLPQLIEWFGNIPPITERIWSEASERYLARLLWELNDKKECGSIDGDARTLPQRHYDCWTVDILAPTTSHFVKKVQQKNEHTRDR